MKNIDNTKISLRGDKFLCLRELKETYFNTDPFKEWMQ